MKFRHLPVTSDQDTTANLEQLQPLLTTALAQVASLEARKSFKPATPTGRVTRTKAEYEVAGLEPSASKDTLVAVTIQVVASKPALLELTVGGNSVTVIGPGGAGIAVESFFSATVTVPAGVKLVAKLAAGVEASVTVSTSYTFLE